MPFFAEEQAHRMYCVKVGNGLCVGSSCMGWRWKPKETRYVKEGDKVPDGWIVSPDDFEDGLIQEDNGKRKYIYYEKVETEKTGYCGIAGYPSKYD